MGDICNMDGDFVTIKDSLSRDSIIEVMGVIPINRNDTVLCEINTTLFFFRSDFLFHRFGFFRNLSRERKRSIMIRNNPRDIASDIIGADQNRFRRCLDDISFDFRNPAI